VTTKTSPRRKRPVGQYKRPPVPRTIGIPKRKLIELSANLPSEQALETVVVSAAYHIRSSRERLLTSDDPGGPHQIRVGLRRIRSALHGFTPYLNAEMAKHLVEQCRALARTVGELRDADVLVEDIVLPVRVQMEKHPGFQPLLNALLEQKKMKRKSVRSALEGPSWLALQDHLEHWPALVDADQTGATFEKVAAKALRRSWRKVDAWGSRLSELSDTERHELRKALKTLRYQVELFGPIYKKRPVGKFLASLKKLQNDFGYLNDVALAHRLGNLHAANSAGNCDLHHVVGFVIGWHTARTEQRMSSLQADWDALRLQSRFW
jgi:triphosphatase